MTTRLPANFFLISAVLVLTTSSTSVAATPGIPVNALTNPGFESGLLSPWFQGRVIVNEGTDWAITNSDSKSGLFSAWVDDNKELRQNFPPIPGSNITEISFWGKHTEHNATEVFVEVFYSDGTSFNANTHATDVFHTINGAWTKIDATSYVVPSKFVTGVSVYGNTNSRFYLDDFLVSVVPEPSAILLCTTGSLTSLALHRRRRPATRPTASFAA